jgi:hypothetical protein
MPCSKCKREAKELGAQIPVCWNYECEVKVLIDKYWAVYEIEAEYVDCSWFHNQNYYNRSNIQ